MKQQNIYDNKEFFERYQSLRDKSLSANELIEIPQLFELIGDGIVSDSEANKKTLKELNFKLEKQKKDQ